MAELQRKELYAFWKEIGYKYPREAEDDSDAKREEEQAKIDSAEPLTEDEKDEMEQLKSEGFGNWNKRDFQAFIRGCEKYGRENLNDILTEVETKTMEELKAYAAAFWEDYTQIADHESLIDKIERGEEKIRKREYVQQQLTSIIKQYKYPVYQLQIPYGNAQKSKNYTEEEDRFLVVTLQKLGYTRDDVYELMRREIRAFNGFRFDWFIKSRTSLELSRRCQTLINLLMKTVADDGMDEDDYGGKKGTKRKPTAASNGSNGALSSAAAGKKKRTSAAGK